MNHIPVAILGATGYTGAELIRLIDEHLHFQLAYLGAHSQEGKRAGDVLPSIGNPTIANMQLGSSKPEDIPSDIELIFTALPHAASASIISALLQAGKRVVDLSADFRHQSASTYQEAYQCEHPCPSLLEQAVYGLCEHTRMQVQHSNLIANPGCYPTSFLLPIIPLLKAGLIDSQGIIVDAKSGISGAGRSAKTNLLYCEINEGLAAYGLPRHRHAWEMDEWASTLGGQDTRVRFVPHIIPMTRGMLTTIHLSGGKPEDWHQTLSTVYQDEAFVQILPLGSIPGTQHVRGSNRCAIGVVKTAAHEGVIVSCIDNLLKGASGQAVQNANIMYQIPETTGLSTYAAWP